MNTYCIKMSRAYETMAPVDFIDGLNITDCSDIDGTRCYLDDIAKEEILKRCMDISSEGIHFIDSGNYHYMSLLMLQKIKEPFDLILVDNHPDMKAASFGNITSCGGWVLEALETLDNLNHIYMYGVRPELIEELLPLHEKVIINANLDKINVSGNDLPVYYSIDKDAFNKSFAITDWDQGNMDFNEFEEIFHYFQNRKFLGADICGDTSEPDENTDVINRISNHLLYDLFK